MVAYNTTAVRNVATTTLTSYAFMNFMNSSLVETVTLRLAIIKPYHHKAVYTHRNNTFLHIFVAVFLHTESLSCDLTIN